jgi:hypothetical protein
MTFASLVDRKSSRYFLFLFLAGVFVFSYASLAHADFGIPSSTLVLYHFSNNTSDTQNNADLTVGTSGGGYVDMVSNLGKAKDVQAPSSFNSANTINLNGKTEATVGAWILPGSDQNQTVPFGNEAGDLFQQISGWKIRCDLPDFLDYNGSTVISSSTATFVACVYKNSHEDLYINGVKDGNGVAAGASISESASKVDVGNWTGGAKWTGHLDDAFIVPVALSTGTLTSIYNFGAGQQICTTDGCGSATSTYTPLLSSPGQFKADASTTLAEGTSTAEHTIVFKATLTSTSTNYLYLEIEVQQASTTFTNVETASSSGVSSGQIASITINADSLVDGNYHWQYRARDAAASTTSAWTLFGATATSTDFVLSRPAGYEISDGSVVALYHFDNNTSDTISNIDISVGTSGGGYVDMVAGLGRANEVKAPSSFNSSNTVSLNGDTSATIGAWILPSSDQNQTVPFGTEAGDLFQQISGYKIRCDLPDFNDYNGTTVMSTSIPTFVVCVYNNSHEDLYINGVKDGQGASVPSSVSESASQVHVGNWNGTAKWSGHLDEAFIISKALSTSTISSLYNKGLGVPICVTAGCGGLYLVAPQQYKSDATSTVNNGSSTTESNVIFGAQLNSNGTSTLQLQVEAQPATSSFTGTPNYFSTSTTPGSNATTTFGTSTLVYPRDPESWSNGNFHWQARVKDNGTGATSAWQQPFGLASATGTVDFKVNTVPLYTQETSTYPSVASTTSWATSTYDNALPGTQCGTGSSSSTIKACGCSITSVVMWLRYFGITTDTLGEDVNPKTLDNWLANVDPNGGYDSVGFLKWNEVTGYASSSDGGAIVYDGINSVNSGSSADVLRPYINTLLSSSTPDPVILFEDNVPDNNATTTHYVVAIGTSTNAGTSTYAIRDSFWYNTQYLNQATSTNTTLTVKGYRNAINGREIYYDPPQPPSWGEYHVSGPDDLMLVDSQGRRTGRDPITGITYREIPNTNYSEAKSPDHVVGELFTEDLANGQYTLYVLGGQTGPYWVDAGHYGQRSQHFRGNIQTGTMIAYVQNYDSANLASSTFSFQGTASSTASITSAAPNNLPPPPVPQPVTPPPPAPAPSPPPSAPSSTEPVALPVILNLVASAASTSVTIGWTTDIPATTQLLFGSSTVMVADVPADTTLTTSHSQRVSHLTPNTTYYYEAQSKDVSGNTGSSAQQSVTTLGSTP